MQKDPADAGKPAAPVRGKGKADVPGTGNEQAPPQAGNQPREGSL